MLTFLKKYSIITASVIFLILSLHIASSNIKGMDVSVITGRVVTLMTAPFISSFNYIIDGTVDMWNNYIHLVNLKTENEVLNANITRLKEENNALKEKLLTDNRLKDLFSFAETVPLSFKVCNVIGLNNDGWLRTMAIDKGIEDGITKNMAVLSSSGIIGRVVDVYPAVSKVMLATDPRSAIDVVIQRSRVKGIAEGKGDSKLILKYVQQFEDVQIGDMVVSAGIGGIFPKGIVVGEVIKVEKDDDAFFKTIEIKTSVDFRKLEEVLIVTGTTG
ncbi:MAG: rod shape-determining protein MreC [Deltaproteobacteria bacterium]|nr:rod shape-determining protein MreC [Deltaproteobacteria bacterium]